MLELNPVQLLLPLLACCPLEPSVPYLHFAVELSLATGGRAPEIWLVQTAMCSECEMIPNFKGSAKKKRM